MIFYRAYGLIIQSDIIFPELTEVFGDAEAQVKVRCGKIDEACDQVLLTKRVFSKSPTGVLLSWPDFGRFLVSQGCEILVEKVPGASNSVIRHLLMGPVFSVLNFQRGMAIFHASAVSLPAGSVAFMAAKGYGKSTQAAAFLQRSGSLITDDLLTLEMKQDLVWAAPGVPFLKLWPEAITHLGGDPCEHPLVKDNLQKRALNQTAGFVDHSTVLRAVFLLDHGQRLELQLLSKREGLRRILPHWYGALFDGDLLPILGFERQFLDCTALVDRVPIYSLDRPVALDRLPEICRAIECVL